MQPWKELADMDQGCAYVVAGNGQRDGRDDYRHAAAGAHGEAFAEDRHAEEDGCDGFQGSEDRVGVDSMYWMAAVVQRNDMAVGKMASDETATNNPMAARSGMSWRRTSKLLRRRQ